MFEVFANFKAFKCQDYKMEHLVIKKSGEFPEVEFDHKKGNLKISGTSFMEDTVAFYTPIMDWLNAYKSTPNDSTEFTFALEYMNTSSSKFLLDIFHILNEIHQKNQGVKVIWCYYEDDEDMEETGKQYEELFDLPFTFQIS